MYEKEFFNIGDISTTTTFACQPRPFRPFKWSHESKTWVAGLGLIILGILFILLIKKLPPSWQIIYEPELLFIIGFLLFFIGFIIDVKNWNCISKTTNNENDWGDTERILIAGFICAFLTPFFYYADWFVLWSSFGPAGIGMIISSVVILATNASSIRPR
jgi:vacuolar-type H+-ATPase subunit I/STV1